MNDVRTETIQMTDKKADRDIVLIEVEVTTDNTSSFKGTAERFYLYPQVRSVFLMSGTFYFLIEVKEESLKDVVRCFSEQLLSVESVLSVKMHDALTIYKL